jgi:apolipoprotein D and lipocalin family protein
MNLIVIALLTLCARVTHARVLVATTCPPASLDSVANFDLKKYVSAPWYSLEQVVVDYQPRNSFYCVRARYIPVDPTDLSKGVDVINYGNLNRPNGPAIGVSGAAGNTSFSLFAIPVPGSGPTAASKLLVGPKQFVANAPAAVVVQQLKAPKGDYRVVAVGPSNNSSLGYDWAIIVGGATAPSNATAQGLCGPSSAKNEGLWLFHRNPLAPASDIALMKQKAKELGIDTSRLEPVVQKGCKYEGAEPTSIPAAAAVAKPGGSSNSSVAQASVQSGQKKMG